mgnify:CR=1 FL=1
MFRFEEAENAEEVKDWEEIEKNRTIQTLFKNLFNLMGY